MAVVNQPFAVSSLPLPLTSCHHPNRYTNPVSTSWEKLTPLSGALWELPTLKLPDNWMECNHLHLYQLSFDSSNLSNQIMIREFAILKLPENWMKCNHQHTLHHEAMSAGWGWVALKPKTLISTLADYQLVKPNQGYYATKRNRRFPDS